MPPSCWPVDKNVGHFLDQCCDRANFTVNSATHGLLALGYISRQAEQGMSGKLGSIVPPRPLHEFLTPGSHLEFML